MAKKLPSPTAEPTAVHLPPLEIKRMTITLVGDSPLICHAWGEKAVKQMLDKQMKRAKQAREAKSPEDDYWSSLYILKDDDSRDVSKMVFGHPATAFKSAAVDACSHVEGVTKVSARGAFHILGDMVVIRGTPAMREDMVKVGMGAADIRYRGEFREWSTTFDLRYNSSVLTAEQILHLFNTAGFAIGVGEWRPEKNGSFGMFHTLREEEALAA